jgi:FkbM family methyltransferase
MATLRRTFPRVMEWTVRRVRGVQARVTAARQGPFEPGTTYPLRYRLRRFLALPPSHGHPSCFVRSASGAWHFLSSDPIDDPVLDGILGKSQPLYFPPLSASAKAELNRGGWICDVGAYNGSWAAEMLVRYPRSRALLVEPNPDKCRNIERTLKANGLASRARTAGVGVATFTGTGVLIANKKGSWARRIEQGGTPQSTEDLRVPTASLGEVLDGIKPVVIKCNGEGAEFALVDQVLELGLYPELMVLMVHPWLGDAAGLRSRLQSAGYEITVMFDDESHPCWHARLRPGQPDV